MTKKETAVYDNLIPLDMLRARLSRDRVRGVALVQVLTKHFGRRGEYYSRLIATERQTERGNEYYTYRLNSQGKVSRSWVALSEGSVIVEGVIGNV